MTLKDKVEIIHYYIPGTLADIAMMIPCHINTLKKIKSGDEDIRLSTAKKIDLLYQKALKIRDLVEE